MNKYLLLMAFFVSSPALSQNPRSQERAARDARVVNCPSRTSLESAEAKCDGSYASGFTCEQRNDGQKIKVMCQATDGGTPVTLSLIGKNELQPPCRRNTRLCTYGQRLYLRIGDSEIKIPSERSENCPNYHTLQPASEDLRQYHEQARFVSTLEKSSYVIEYILNEGATSGRLLVPMPAVRIDSEFALLVDVTQNGRRRVLSCRNEGAARSLPRLRTIAPTPDPLRTTIAPPTRSR